MRMSQWRHKNKEVFNLYSIGLNTLYSQNESQSVKDILKYHLVN